MDVVDDLRNFIRKDILFSIDTNKANLPVNEDLLGTGIMDSLGILKIAAFIEERFGVTISDVDIIAENFSTLHSIEHMIRRKSLDT
jgi:acyl carrier protein